MICFRLGCICVALLAVLIVPRPALALSPDDLIRGILGMAVQEVSRQQQRESTRAQPQQGQAAAAERRLSSTQRLQIQEALNARGFNVGKPDGSFGRNTRKGIASYQSSRGQPADGVLKADQIADLLSFSATPSRSAASRIQQVSSTGFSIAPGIDYPGHDFREVRDTGLSACQAMCSSESRCQAFTHNTAKNVCFLKSDVGRSVRFSGAVSGLKAVAAARPVGEFDILPDTDVPGGDYRGGLTDARLRDISIAACQAACAVDGQCAAFTYNEPKAVCFLKSAVGRTQSFAGAISGIRRSAAATPDDDIAWKEGESRADFIARVRAAAKPFGGSCEAERNAFRQLAATIRVGHGSLSSVSAEESVALDWAHDEHRDLPPAYLVIAAEKAVRFSGDGFYALMPGARAPFGIEARGDQTRAIVPLPGVGARSGEVYVHPVLAGQLRLEWFLAGYLRQCGEELVHEIAGGEIVVKPGQPEIAVADPFALSRPIRTIVSPDGTRLIREYDDRFQLLETGRMSALGDYTGTFPRFSATGRFVTYHLSGSEVGGSSSVRSNILDAVDGRYTGSSVNAPAAWAHDDSFVIGDGSGYGIVDVVNPLRASGDLSGDNRISCFACSAWDETRFRLDLENNVAVFATETSNEQYLHIKSLTSDSFIAHDMWNEKVGSKAEVMRLFRQRHQIAGFREPSRWEPEGGLKLSMPKLDPLYRDHPSARNHDRFYLEPTLLPERSVEMASPDPQASLSRSVEWRGASPMTRHRQRDQGYVEKLEDFGFEFAQRATPEVLYDASNPLPNEAGFLDRFRDELWRKDGRLREMIRTTTSTSSGQTFTNNCASPFTHDIATGERLSFDIPDIDAQGVWRVDAAEFHFLQIYCQDGARAAMPWTEFFILDAEHPKGIRAAEFSGSFFHLYEGGTLVGWSPYDAQVANIADFSQVRKVEFPSRNSLTVDVRLTEDRDHVVQINSDGSFYVHALESASQILEGRYLDDEIVVWTPDLRFDATSEGAHYISARFPGNLGLYTFQQLAARLQVEGLVEQTLSHRAPSERPEIGVPPHLSVEIEAIEARRITGSAIVESMAAVGEVRVFQDGVLTDTIAVGDVARTGFEVPRLPGARWISFVAVDELGLLSLPVGRDLGAVESGELPVVRSLSVGVDRYDDERLRDLSFAVADTRTLAASLAAFAGNSFTLAASRTLADEEASPEAVLAEVERVVGEAGAGDTVAFFFAGHGVTGDDGRYYLATTTTDAGRIAETALSWDAISAILGESKARVLVFLDACHSGVAGMDMAATNDDAAAGMLAGVPSGLVILSASKGRQFSEENSAVGGGVFTNAVADVIARQRQAHDVDGNGVIEVSELYAGVKRLVVERTEGRQTPWLARNQMVGDFALF